MHPLAVIFEGQTGRHLIYTGLTEAFFTYVKVSFWAAVCLAFPIVASQIWKFVAPGLYKNERRAFYPYLFATPVLFAMGAALAYFVVIPVAWRFFVSFETPAAADGGLPIVLEAKVNEYLSLVMTLLFALRRRVSIAGAADPDGAGRAGHLGRARLQTPLCDRHHVRRRCGTDPARHHQPDQPRHPADHPLRGLDRLLPHGREGARQARGRRRSRTRRQGQARRRAT